MRGAEFVHGDLIGLSVSHEPLVGVEAVVAGAELLDDFINGAAVLNGHAGAEGDGRALRIERGLADGGFGEDDAGIVLIPIGAALDGAGVALHEDAVAVGGLHVDPDIGLFGEGEGPPSHMADDHFAVLSGGSGGEEGGAVIEDGIALLIVVSGGFELKVLETGGSYGHGGAEFVEFDGDVGDDDID